MQSRSNREFKELIAKVYEQKFDSKNYMKKWVEEIKLIPSFFYDELTKKIKIELKEDAIVNHSTDLGKFYDDLQHIQNDSHQQLILEIQGDEALYKEILSRYIDIIYFINF